MDGCVFTKAKKKKWGTVGPHGMQHKLLPQKGKCLWHYTHNNSVSATKEVRLDMWFGSVLGELMLTS